MHPLHITMAGGFYDRTRAIIDGSVRPEGIELTYVELPIEEVFWRVLRYGEFEVAECSLAYYMISRARGIGHDYVAIPLFPSRRFRPRLRVRQPPQRHRPAAGPQRQDHRRAGVRDDRGGVAARTV